MNTVLSSRPVTPSDRSARKPHTPSTRRPFAPTRLLPLGLLSGALVAGGIGYATQTPAQSKYMSVDEVKPGMKGYGLTVMSGSKPERFEVEILSTLHSFRPGQELFIIKTDHPRLQAAKTVAGMSGSPIFIDDKMIGAYAYGWYFNVEPIAGVTPIKHMLDDMKRPVPKVLAPFKSAVPLPQTGAKLSLGATGLPTRGAHRFVGKPLDYEAAHHATQVASMVEPKLRAPHGYGLKPASTELMVAGLGPKALKMLNDVVEPMGIDILQSGAGGTALKKMIDEAPTKYEDGGAISVSLVRGDVSISGLGTVTHVLGDQLVAFGHPMLGGGIENLPTSLSHIHWILASQQRSFKLGEATRPLGALVNDRQASIVVHTNREAPVFPVKLKVNGAPGAPKTEWNMEVAHDQFFAPIFTAIGMGSALETTAGERGDRTWRSKTKLSLKDHGTMEFEDFGAGNQMPVGISDIFRAQLVRAIGALLNNPWEMGHITGVEMEIDITNEKQEIAFIRGLTVLTPEIDPGETAKAKLTLIPYLGERFEKVIEVPIHKRFAGQTVYISLTPGYMSSRVVAPPENFKDLVDILPKLAFPQESLIASYALPNELTVAFEGKVAERVPGHATDLLSSSNTTIQPLMFGAQEQIIIPTKGFIVGRDAFSVRVRNPMD